MSTITNCCGIRSRYLSDFALTDLSFFFYKPAILKRNQTANFHYFMIPESKRSYDRCVPKPALSEIATIGQNLSSVKTIFSSACLGELCM